MDTDSLGGDVESVHSGPSLRGPLVEQLLVDAVTQQQGWLRVYGKGTERAGGLHGPGARGQERGEVMAAAQLRLASSSWTEFDVSAR